MRGGDSCTLAKSKLKHLTVREAWCFILDLTSDLVPCKMCDILAVLQQSRKKKKKKKKKKTEEVEEVAAALPTLPPAPIDDLK